ncbi:hypothetical protein VCHA48O428_40036 [Vibrio chagasii]|nr:hypothetical protein VCHA31O71_20086 [Vibrio chagasii]CAH6893038.1 hypothetical protein VCHA36O163_20543 [Vibrio chagasii]CAH7249517.1 hypothetical protein VCHA49P382_20086 [Vibrio chagasii]CAH7310741.1 hypothetical protein VCHA48O428_40036 [Vibrio chagasii]CAH7408322.1 hypothetical protein VCHA54O482_20542 [Vibrio chagasii]
MTKSLKTGKKEKFRHFETCTKMQRGRKELQAMGARSIPVLKIGDQIMVGWNQKNFDKMYNSKNT